MGLELSFKYQPPTPNPHPPARHRLCYNNRSRPDPAGSAWEGMCMELTELPLFPLHAVLFPGIGQSLNIFEDRYKVMLADCLQGTRRLGIVGIETGAEVGGPAVPYLVGCLAQIIEVENGEEGQAFVIQVAGLERIRVLEIDQESKPYLQGRVELWPDETL